MTTFSAQVKDWTTKTKAVQEAVIREATQRTVDLMQKPVAKGGNMPVDTGFLRGSIKASFSGPVPMTKSNPGAPTSGDYSDVTLAIAGLDGGQVLWVTYTANYAAHVEYGARGRPPRGFVRKAAQRWPATVNQVVREIR